MKERKCSGKTGKPQNQIDSLIGAGTRIDGNISFSGGLRVDGHVTGNIIALGEKPSTLVLSDQAVIEGKISVSHAVINGTVVGAIQASEYVELQAQGQSLWRYTLQSHGNSAWRIR